MVDVYYDKDADLAHLADKTIGIIRIFFQPWDRSDELAEVKVEVRSRTR